MGDLSPGFYYMYFIGLDIGTTSISLVLLEGECRKLNSAITVPNEFSLSSNQDFIKTQDPNQIVMTCQRLLQETLTPMPYLEQREVKAIGLTGQMHGVLYVDEKGRAVSPLFTWQDQSGDQIYQEKETYAAYASRISGFPLATGFGSTTLFYHTKTGQVPGEAVRICTIADYLAMHLVGGRVPKIHVSMAASLGLFDLEVGQFDLQAIGHLQLDESLFPETVKEEIFLGKTVDGIPVAIPIGDNQASFLGAVGSSLATPDRQVLLNVGTGSQISLPVRTMKKVKKGEYRPYLNGTYLWVGSPLCGGYSYHLLKNFYQETLKVFAQDPKEELYPLMNNLANEQYQKEKAHTDKMSDVLEVDTRFRGTREEPGLRGGISNLSEFNLGPADLTLGFLKGIAQELHDYYLAFVESMENEETQESKVVSGHIHLIGSGNGLRKNPLLQEICGDFFESPMSISDYSEEAASGCALLAGDLCRVMKTLK